MILSRKNTRNVKGGKKRRKKPKAGGVYVTEKGTVIGKVTLKKDNMEEGNTEPHSKIHIAQ